MVQFLPLKQLNWWIWFITLGGKNNITYYCTRETMWKNRGVNISNRKEEADCKGASKGLKTY